MEDTLKIDGYKEHSCNCTKCEMMCFISPCFPTPREVRKLVDAGYKNRLMCTMFFDITTNRLYPLIAPTDTQMDMFNVCTFLNKERRCELHENGLKPSEGKLAKHDDQPQNTVKLRVAICETWNSEEGLELFKEFGNDKPFEEAKEMEENIVRQLSNFVK